MHWHTAYDKHTHARIHARMYRHYFPLVVDFDLTRKSHILNTYNFILIALKSKNDIYIVSIWLFVTVILPVAQRQQQQKKIVPIHSPRPNSFIYSLHT